MSAIRTFIAIDLVKPVVNRAAELISRLAGVDAKISWADADHMHLTLKFLGDVPETDVPQAIAVTREAVAGFGPFAIRCAGAGAFPSLERPRTVWLGVRDGADELVELNERIETALTKLRFPRENRRFTPHVTLGRVRRPGPGLVELTRLLKENEEFEAGQTDVGEVVVYSSELTKQGPVYAAMSRIPLT